MFILPARSAARMWSMSSIRTSWIDDCEEKDERGRWRSGTACGSRTSPRGLDVTYPVERVPCICGLEDQTSTKVVRFRQYSRKSNRIPHASVLGRSPHPNERSIWDSLLILVRPDIRTLLLVPSVEPSQLNLSLDLSPASGRVLPDREPLSGRRRQRKIVRRGVDLTQAGGMGPG